MQLWLRSGLPLCHTGRGRWPREQERHRVVRYISKALFLRGFSELVFLGFGQGGPAGLTWEKHRTQSRQDLTGRHKSSRTFLATLLPSVWSRCVGFGLSGDDNLRRTLVRWWPCCARSGRLRKEPAQPRTASRGTAAKRLQRFRPERLNGSSGQETHLM